MKFSKFLNVDGARLCYIQTNGIRGIFTISEIDEKLANNDNYLCSYHNETWYCFTKRNLETFDEIFIKVIRNLDDFLELGEEKIFIECIINQNHPWDNFKFELLVSKYESAARIKRQRN